MGRTVRLGYIRKKMQIILILGCEHIVLYQRQIIHGRSYERF